MVQYLHFRILEFPLIYVFSLVNILKKKNNGKSPCLMMVNGATHDVHWAMFKLANCKRLKQGVVDFNGKSWAPPLGACSTNRLWAFRNIPADADWYASPSETVPCFLVAKNGRAKRSSWGEPKRFQLPLI